MRFFNPVKIIGWKDIIKSHLFSIASSITFSKVSIVINALLTLIEGSPTNNPTLSKSSAF